MRERPLHELEAGMVDILAAPTSLGRVELIARRPGSGERELLERATLDVESGLVGDDWSTRGSKRMPDGSSDREAQVTIMSSRVAALLAGGPDGWAIAGDQLYVDLALGMDELPPGSRLRLGTAVVEISAVPHTGCVKFAGRFGSDALRFVSSPNGRQHRLRGVNARVVMSGVVRVGDAVVPG